MSIQINKKIEYQTKHIRIDTGLHKILKVAAAKNLVTIRYLVEACLADNLKEVLEDLNEK